MALLFRACDDVGHHDGEHVVKQSCSPHGGQESEGGGQKEPKRKQLETSIVPKVTPFDPLFNEARSLLLLLPPSNATKL